MPVAVAMEMSVVTGGLLCCYQDDFYVDNSCKVGLTYCSTVARVFGWS